MATEKHDPAAHVGGDRDARRDRGTRTGSTLLRLEGKDALSVLHRISTQSLEDLRPGQARSTLFCDFRGRLLHRAAVAVTRDGAVWMLRPDAPPEELVEYIDRHVFREELRIAISAVEVHAMARGSDAAPATLFEKDGVPERVQLDLGFGLGVGSATDEVGSETDSERILAGRPRHGFEIHPDFNPFEVGLALEVHLNKGCFTGQEALMRLITYKSVRRRLARVSGGGPRPEVPRDLILTGETVGRLTSAAGDGEGWVGLAVVKHATLSQATGLVLAEGGAIDELIAFPENRPLGLP